MRKGFCITSDETNDFFVGVRFTDGNPEVVFPHGYNIPDDEKEQRKDIFRLLAVLQKFSDHREGSSGAGTADLVSSLPLLSYQYIMHDFLAHGYYVEKETEYVTAAKGKISWKRTIQKQKPQLNGGNAIYLNFQVKTDRVNENRLITRIHKYCVYHSFRMFGWLYFNVGYLPPAPDIPLDKKLFLSVLRTELGKTFNDNKKRLFTSMIHIIQEDAEDINYRNATIGVNHFAGIWEKLIDRVFGEEDKARYFPTAQWTIIENGRRRKTSPLMPDTIMKYQDKIYVLDAKYYRYGITQNENDLPDTSSIHKQITYGRHIANMADKEYPPSKIYNAFVMPYNGSDGPYVLKFVAVGTGEWEEYRDDDDSNYPYILGLLLDTRHLITTYTKHNLTEIEALADMIESSVREFRAGSSPAEKEDWATEYMDALPEAPLPVDHVEMQGPYGTKAENTVNPSAEAAPIAHIQDYQPKARPVGSQGRIAAGSGLDVDTAKTGEKENIPTDRHLLDSVDPNKFFYLTVEGDSMNQAGIEPGDKVLIRRSSRPKTGDIVAALINSDEVTLKRFHKYSDHVELKAESTNPLAPSFRVDAVEFENGTAKILGVVKDVVKEE